MKKILMIDDEEKIRNVYEQALTEEGFEVFNSKDASEGTFKLISKERIDLILLDINMPGVNGIEMRDIINEYDPKIKVIVSSVYPVDEQKNAVPDAYDYFDKAHGINVLISKVKNALSDSCEEKVVYK